MDKIVPALASSVQNAKSLEQLARPLLELLRRTTGMESAYLTRLNSELTQQTVQFASNEGALKVTEGLTVNWDDTLCKRALAENRFYCPDVPTHWGESLAARELKIQSYLSAPIRKQNGDLLGTLCAISSQPMAAEQQVEPLLKLISALLSFSVEREEMLHKLQESHTQLEHQALTDSLTELPNRRAFLNELPRLFAAAKREQTFVLIGAVDLDNLKRVNDQFGHAAGDQLIKAVAWRLHGSLRETDLLGRTGGDEFFFATLGIAQDASLPVDSTQTAQRLQARLSKASAGSFSLGPDLPNFDYAGASIGVAIAWPEEIDIEHAMSLADQAMYRDKARRKAQHQ